MNTDELETALRAKFSAPEYALMFNVRNGTGFARKTDRYADALAMSLWPSRGLELIGFELKASRSDWQRELKNPEKMVIDHDFGTVEHRIDLYKTNRVDCYRAVADGKLWRARIGWAKVLEGLRKSLPRVMAP